MAARNSLAVNQTIGYSQSITYGRQDLARQSEFNPTAATSAGHRPAGRCSNAHRNGAFFVKNSMFVALGLPLLLLTACGSEPPCNDPGVLHTVKDIATKYMINHPLRGGVPGTIDLTSSMSLQTVIVRTWNADLKAAECSARFSADHRKLYQLAKDNVAQIDHKDLRELIGRQRIEDINAGPLQGTILYSAKATTDGKRWIEVQDLRAD